MSMIRLAKLIVLTSVLLSPCIATSADAPVYHAYAPAVIKTTNAKKGIGLSYRHCEDVAAVGASWEYGWCACPCDCDYRDDVPMLWGYQQLGATVSGDSDWLLGFNEPDRPEQANLTPWEAAELWRALDAEHADRLLVSPAPSHLDPQWLQRFRWAYALRYGESPRLDALAIHCYGGFEGCKAVIEQVVGYANEWGVEGGVWVTEFATPPCLFSSQSEALAQARALIQWMDAEPRVARYAWFASRINGDEWWGPDPACMAPLVDYDTGQLTVWGQMYRGQ